MVDYSARARKFCKYASIILTISGGHERTASFYVSNMLGGYSSSNFIWRGVTPCSWVY